MQRSAVKIGIFLFLIILIPDSVMAGTITSRQSGVWSSPSTWAGGVVPGDTDEVLIADGHAVEIDQDIGAGVGLKMLRVGTQNGSAARLFFDGHNHPQGATLRFASQGKTQGVDAFGIQFFGSVDLEGTADHPLVIEPVLQDGSAMTFIQKDPNSSHVDLTLRNVTLRWAGDENNAGINVSGASRSGERVVVEGNRFEGSGAIQLAGADGASATISVSRNTAVQHRGSFIQFRAAKNLLIDQNQITLVFFPATAPGQAVIDSMQGDQVGTGIRITGNTITSTLNADAPDVPQRYAVWINGFTHSTVSDNQITSSGVSYGFEEGIALLANSGGGSNIQIDHNTISGALHGIGIHAQGVNPGIAVSRNQLFNNRNEGIFIEYGRQVQIVNNLLYGTLHSGQAGILLYNTDGVQIINNTLNGDPNASTAGIAIGNPGIGSSGNVVIKNNILTGWHSAIQNRPSGNTFQEVSHNLFFQNAVNYDLTPIPRAGSGDVSDDPKYVDAASNDDHLQTGSPAIDRADASGAPAIDLDGKSRPIGAGFDMGAYEYSPPTDLAVTLTASPDPVSVGGTLTGVITVTNRGPASALGVVVTITPASQATLLSATTTQGSCNLGGSCTLGTLASGAQATITLQMTVNAAGDLQSTSHVAGQEGDPNPSNNDATAITHASSASSARADLKVVLAQGADPVPVGSIATTATVTNLGPDRADEVVLTDHLPQGAVGPAARPSQGDCQTAADIVCHLGALESGVTATVQITFQIATPGSYQNTVTVTGAGTDPDTSNNTASEETTVILTKGGPPPSSNSSGSGCGMVEPSSRDRGFRRSDLGDLLLFFWPIIYFLYRKSARAISPWGRNARWIGAILFLLLPLEAGAATITSARSGSWSSAATWAGGRVPGDGDEVIIADGHTVQIDRDIGTAGQGLKMLHVGTRNGSTAVLKYDGTAAARGYTVTFGSTGKSEGQNSFGIRFWGTVDLEGTSANPLTLTPRITNGQAITFIRKETQSTQVALTLSYLNLHFLGDEQQPGIDASGGSQITISDNRFDQSGAIQLFGADGTHGTAAIRRNTATGQKGSFVQFRAAKNLLIDQNQITLVFFPTTAPGQAVIDSMQGDQAGTGIQVTQNTITSTLNADAPNVPQRYAIWINGFTHSSISDNQIAASGVSYGFEEGIALLANSGEGSNIQIDHNTISGALHGIGIHATGSNPGIAATRNKLFNNRNEDIFVEYGNQVQIVNNILYGTLHSGQAGILLYNTDGVQIMNNTLEGDPSVSTAGIAIGNQGIGTSTNVVIKNNILTRWHSAIQNRPSGNTFQAVSHNLFFQNTVNYDLTPIPGAGSGDVLDDPKYVDLASSNYHLQAGSPAIDRADAIGAPAVDIDGQARPYGNGFDIGADEASSDAPVIDPPACSGSGCASQGSNSSTTPSSAEGQTGGGCTMIRPRRPGEAFNQADRGDLLLLSIPLFYYLLMKRKRSFTRGRGR